ncbi:MAG: hypothetical protein Q8R76_08930 [Candidatus Omnitrophota bacterium]|nr:hypothetical protein [Candidatus Omnitrophota bacterium]
MQIIVGIAILLLLGIPTAYCQGFDAAEPSSEEVSQSIPATAQGKTFPAEKAFNFQKYLDLANEAETDARQAGHIADLSAKIISDQDATRKQLQAALIQLTEAGKMFENANRIWKSIAPDFASSADIENSTKAISVCIVLIDAAQQRLSRMPR